MGSEEIVPARFKLFESSCYMRFIAVFGCFDEIELKFQRDLILKEEL